MSHSDPTIFIRISEHLFLPEIGLKYLGIFQLLARRKEFERMLMDTLLREVFVGEIYEASNNREHVPECNLATVFPSLNPEINHSLEMGCTFSGYTARFTVRYHRYIQAMQMQ
jgi:hypothetical protein